MGVNIDVAETAGHSPGRFITTRWSVVLSCADSGIESAAAHDALSALCKTYWRPIFAYLCRRGYSTQDAEDLTQDFFSSLLQGPLLKRADPERGRFRSLLLKALQDFLGHATEKLQARKRGGGVKFVSWDDWMAEAPSHLMLPIAAEKSWPAEKIFDVRWAATAAEQALRRLQEECEAHKRPRVFDVLSGALTADRREIVYEPLARELGVKPGEIKRLLHRLRLRYRELLRAEVAETVADPAEVDEEVRYLVAALSVGMEAADKSA